MYIGKKSNIRLYVTINVTPWEQDLGVLTELSKYEPFFGGNAHFF